ncbi:hypothetical protein PYW07_008980 [Mythimna separata]|uniref:Uncharacterized protein n=1 Tax=Mythimna separata TaxID=271217 RepID=A0AAD7YB29_MYTSE|nr:hypothetical protein PYW07_008980 [Mythimna separata]
MSKFDNSKLDEQKTSLVGQVTSVHRLNSLQRYGCQNPTGSSTVVNNGGVNFEEKNEVAPGPPCNWLSLRKAKSQQNDNGTNAPKWGFEHRDRNWMGAITGDNGYNKLHESNEKNASSPCKWFFHKGSELQQSDNGPIDMKWNFDHQDENWTNAKPWENGFAKPNDKHAKNANPPSKWLSLHQCSENGDSNQEWSIERRERTWMYGKPWGRCMKKRFEHADRKAGPPCRFRSFRRSKSLENDNDKKWEVHQHRAWSEAKSSDTCVNKYNDEAKQPSMWISLRKYCKSYHNDDGTNGKKWNFQHLNKTWMDAITWSGVAVFGWYTSQLIHLKLKQHCRLHETKCLPVNNLITSIYPYITDMNKNDFYIDSISKIGKVFSDFTPTVYLMANDQSGSLKVKENVTGNFVNSVSENLVNSVSSSVASNVSEHITSNASEHNSVHSSGNRSGNSAQTHPHSPTNAQSIDTSNDDLGGVLNSIENRLGLASIENGQYQDGLSLLRSAAERNHAPAIYNLGLCYEKGLGVTANEKTAMELYKSAAALDHPEALYNLGIFYGQGRGGLKADQETAVRLLRLAAVQGQKDAIDALKYLDVSISEPRHKDVNSWTYQDHTQFSSSQNIVPTQSKLFIDNINFLQARV